ncbi:hypothetical protein MASR2M41_04520 [Flammeovirgaceae bacterium]
MIVSAIFATSCIIAGNHIKKFTIMSITRLKRKARKDKAKSSRRRTELKVQNFKPVMKSIDIEKIKEEFKAKK